MSVRTSKCIKHASTGTFLYKAKRNSRCVTSSSDHTGWYVSFTLWYFLLLFQYGCSTRLPKLGFAWGWLPVSWCSSGVSHCAPGAPGLQSSSKRGMKWCLLWGQESPGAQVSKAVSSEHQRAWGKEMGPVWVHCVCVRVCTAAPLLPSLPVHLLEPSLLKKGSSSSLTQGKEESEGKHLALAAAFTAQTSLPCFLQVSRGSGSATALLLAESSSCTAFKGFANHQWYTSIWEPLV